MNKLFILLSAATALLVGQVSLGADDTNILPAGSQLAFVRDGQIWLYDIDSAGLLQLTDTESGTTNGNPAWSSDGRRLAFSRSSEGGQTANIFVINADGSNEVQVTNEVRALEPAWAPDGHTLVYVRDLVAEHSTDPSGLFLINVDAETSQGSTLVLGSPGYLAQPAWSPDGQTITYTSDSRAFDFTYDLGAVNPDGSNARFLVQWTGSGPVNSFNYYFQSTWSPDGQSIALVKCQYAWENCYPDSEIAIVNADGSDLRVIAQTGGYASPTWSPDGSWIAFGSAQCSKNCASSVRFVSADGAVEGLLIEDGHSPAWRPKSGARIDGDRLIVPGVLIGSDTYDVELRVSKKPNSMGQYPIGTSPVMQTFELVYAVEAPATTSEYSAAFDEEDGKLTVTRLQAGDLFFWAVFSIMWDTEPLLLELVDFGADDEDDDNDGTRDINDPEPHLANSSEDPYGIVGLWTLRTEISSDLTGTPCEQFQKVVFIDTEISYDSNEGAYVFSSDGQSIKQDYPYYPWALFIDVSVPIDEGYFELVMDLDIKSSQLISGTEVWSWNGVLESCRNKQSIVSMVRKLPVDLSN